MAERTIEEESMIASCKWTENKPGGRYGGSGGMVVASLGFGDGERKDQRKAAERRRKSRWRGHGHRIE